MIVAKWFNQVHRVAILLLFVVGVSAGCGGNRGYVYQAPMPPNSLQLICEQRNIAWQWDSTSQVFTFSSEGTPSKAMVGSKLVLVGARQVILNYPVERKLNTLIVPPDFIRKVFGATDQTVVHAGLPQLMAGRFQRIMIDAGHGGKDPGAKGVGGIVEKEVVLDIAQKLKAKLTAMGFEVLMTRDGDEFISLQERTELATRQKADLFLSIHANATQAKKIRGLEIYYSRKLDKNTDVSQKKNNEEEFLKALQISGDRAVTEKIIADLVYTKKLEDSSVIAEKVISKTSRDLSAVNRGVRSSGFFVVKNTLIPAVLFEVGYLTNASEAKLLKTQEYRQKIADAIALSVQEYNHEF